MNVLEQAREAHLKMLDLRTDRYQSMVRNAFNAGALAAMTLLPEPKRQKYRGVSAFLRRLGFEGGSIVCTNALTVEQISEAREQGRMLVLADGVGFVIRPAGVQDRFGDADLAPGKHGGTVAVMPSGVPGLVKGGE